MKIETLRNNHKKKIIIGGMILTCILSGGIFLTSKAKYLVTDRIKLGEGIINYAESDLNFVALYLDDTLTKNVPTNGYVLNSEKSSCTVNGEKVGTIEYTGGRLNFLDINKSGTKCTVYLDKYVVPKTITEIIAGLNPKTSANSFTGIATSEDTGIYSITDPVYGGTTYYYRGILNDSTINNWVDFAGYKWRIIRINGDGSIRMIYNGTSIEQTGTVTQYSTRAYARRVDLGNAYVGYMFGTENGSTYAATHANTNNSFVKEYLDNWYKTNIVDKNYDSYISKEVGFCGDRALSSGTGIGKSRTDYGAYGRLASTPKKPSNNCNTSDLYTVAASSRGNKALTYPVGLITADEVVYAGGSNQTNTTYWLYTNQNYWTMSPERTWNDGSGSLYAITNNGILQNKGWEESLGLRPVINLLPNLKFIGEGTTSNPYKLS